MSPRDETRGVREWVRRRQRRLGRELVAATLLLGTLSTAATAQTPTEPGARPTPFARFVPSSSRLFVRVRHLGEVDEALRRAHAWRFLPLLAGSSATEVDSFDLRATVEAFLGPRSSVDVDDWMQTEVGLAASAYSHLGDPVWFVRLADNTVLDRWFPDQRKPADSRRRIRVFRAENQVLVCERDGVAVLARGAGDVDLLRSTVELMSGRPGEALADQDGYRELMAYLPANPLAVAYLAPAVDSGEATSGAAQWWPSLDRAVIGLYEGEGRLDLAIRASPRTPHRKGRLSAEARRRMMRLPQTTLVAATFPLDIERALEQSITGPAATTVDRYLMLIRALRGTEGLDSASAVPVGPHVITAWGQDLSEHGSTPQLAVMVESAEARTLGIEWTRMVENIAKMLDALDPQNPTPMPGIQRHEHLGTVVSFLPLGTFAQTSRLPFLRLFANVEPCWATLGDWLVIALTRQHLERVLDAQNGLIPTLSTVREIRPLNLRGPAPTVLAVARAGLASDVLDRWLADLDAGKPSLLDPTWPGLLGRWSDPVEPPFGLSFAGEPGSGAVTVLRIVPGSAAEGRLQLGDRILGVDGRLLGLSDPEADVRQRLSVSPAEAGPTLRVQRGEVMTNVLLPRGPREVRRNKPALGPTDAIRELASLGRTLQLAVFAVQATQEDRYSARLTLRFASTQAP